MNVLKLLLPQSVLTVNIESRSLRDGLYSFVFELIHFFTFSLYQFEFFLIFFKIDYSIDFVKATDGQACYIYH